MLGDISLCVRCRLGSGFVQRIIQVCYHYGTYIRVAPIRIRVFSVALVVDIGPWAMMLLL